MESTTETELALGMRLLAFVLLLVVALCAAAAAVPGHLGAPHLWVIPVLGPVCLVLALLLLRASPSLRLLHATLIGGLALDAAAIAATGGAHSAARFALPLIVAFVAAFLPARTALPYMALAIGVHLSPLAYDHRAGSVFDAELAVAIPAYVLLALGGLRTKRTRHRLWVNAEALRTEHAALRRVATQAVAGGDGVAFFNVAAEEAGRLLGADVAGLLRFDGADAEVVGSWGEEGRTRLGVGARMAAGPGTDLHRVRQWERPLSAPMTWPGAPVHELGWGSLVLAPVMVGGKVWGALAAVCEASFAFPENAETRIVAFADVLGLAVASARDRAQLAEQAATDPLTGLTNRRVFHDAVEREVARSERHRRPLTLVLIDVDYFKQLNDLAGHEAGDESLAALAEALRDIARADDVLGRLGGDELAWLMPETAKLDALAAVERLRQGVAADGVAGHHLTFSAGICGLEHATSAEELFRSADAALYWSKAHGRNASWVYDPGVIGGLSAEERSRSAQRSQAVLGLRALARAVDAKDVATEGHSERVADLATRLAAVRGWSRSRQALLREAALVHDVGKIGIPDELLLKPGRLTADELGHVRAHAELGAQIAADVLRPEQVEWVRSHHERPDGRGYPSGLRAEQIPEGAALLGVAEAWDAMTRSRSYAMPKPVPEARAELRLLSGTQFSPQAVEALESVLAADPDRSTVSASE